MITDAALIIPCHNYGPYLAEALQSVLDQTVPPAETVIVDDGSTDSTPDVIEEMLPQLRRTSSVTVLRHTKPAGLVRSIEEAISSTTAPLFAHIDADDRCLPQFIERLTIALDEHPDAGYAYPRMRLFGDETGTYLTHEFDIARLLFQGNYIPHVAAIRRSAFAASRGYRNLRTHMDWDLWLTLYEAGFSGLLVDEVLYEWRRHGRAMTYQPQVTRLRTRLDILWHHRELARRYLRQAPRWTLSMGVRRIRKRDDASVLTASGWVVPETNDGHTSSN